MSSSPSLIIFDCDGVLVDSELLACHAVALSLSEIGIPLDTSEIVARYAGVSADAMYKDLETRSGHEISPKFRENVRRRILEEFEHYLQPMDGIAAALELLDCAVCVASSSDIARIRFSLTKTGLLKYFDNHLFSATQVSAGKPAPDLFEFAAAQMEFSAENCVVIEDSIKGIVASKKAGMTGIGFFGGSHCAPDHAEKLRAAGATITFGHMRQLPVILGKVSKHS